MTVVNLNLLTSVSIKKDSLPHCCQPKFSMPTATPPTHAVDAPQIEASSGTADIGTCKRRPVEVPLNSEVKHLAALVMKKKACLDKKSYKPLMSTVTRMVSCHSWNLHVVMIQLLLVMFEWNVLLDLSGGAATKTFGLLVMKLLLQVLC